MGSRSDVAKLVVLITDGKAQDQELAEEEAEKMRDDGVLVSLWSDGDRVFK